jgi:hypothetical protein
MHSRATDRRSASKCQGKWPDQTPDQAFGLPEVLVAVSTSRLSCKKAGKPRTLMPGLGFIWRISDETSLAPGQVQKRRMDDLKPFVAIQRVQLPPGKGEQPAGSELCMGGGNTILEA